MARYKLTIEYDGRPFAGWQRQPDQPTVQAHLERALEQLDGKPGLVEGAGRTDSGVHAVGQVAHIDLQKHHEPNKVADALNYYLRPSPIAVVYAKEVDESFHARFSARARHYSYRIVNRRADLTVDAGFAWRVGGVLDAELMHQAAQSLIGHHDFTTFRDVQCQADSPEKTLDVMRVRRAGADLYVECSAKSFLHRQVRSMVGSLVDVGRGKQPASWIADALAARDRTACGPVAPSDGLFLTRVDYRDPYQ